MSSKRKKPMKLLFSADARSRESVHVRPVSAGLRAGMKPAPDAKKTRLKKPREPRKPVYRISSYAGVGTSLKLWSVENMLRKKTKKKRFQLASSDLSRPSVQQLGSVVSICQGSREEDEEGATSANQPNCRNDDFLCTTLCDLLIDIPTRWDEGRSQEILGGLKTCGEDDSDEDTEHTHFVDLRGRYIDEAKGFLILTLYRWFSTTGYLNVRVGCEKHGIGEAKLKDTIIGMLDLDPNVIWRDLDTIISIQLNGQKNYQVIKESLEGRFLPMYFDDDDLYSNEYSYFASSSKEVDYRRLASRSRKEKVVPCDVMSPTRELHLCTIACDLLIGLRRPAGHWDERTRQRVLAGFEKCYKRSEVALACGDECIEGIDTVDLRGLYIVDATELLVQRLDHISLLSPTRCLNVIVGCKEHGVGEGKLKQAIFDMFKLHDTLEFNDEVCTITISVDGKTDYGSLRRVFLEDFTSDYDNDDSHSLLSGSSLSYDSYSESISDAEYRDIYSDAEFRDIYNDDVYHAVTAARDRESLDFFENSMGSHGGLNNMEDEGSLRTVICKLLFDCPEHLYQWWDERILNGMEDLGDFYDEYYDIPNRCRCSGSNSLENSHITKISSNCMDKVLKLLCLHLYTWSHPLALNSGYVDLIVGCKLYGFWSRTSKDAIVDTLTVEGYNWRVWEDAKGCVTVLIKFASNDKANRNGVEKP